MLVALFVWLTQIGGGLAVGAVARYTHGNMYLLRDDATYPNYADKVRQMKAEGYSFEGVLLNTSAKACGDGLVITALPPAYRKLREWLSTFASWCASGVEGCIARMAGAFRSFLSFLSSDLPSLPPIFRQAYDWLCAAITSAVQQGWRALTSHSAVQFLQWLGGLIQQFAGWLWGVLTSQAMDIASDLAAFGYSLRNLLLGELKIYLLQCGFVCMQLWQGVQATGQYVVNALQQLATAMSNAFSSQAAPGSVFTVASNGFVHVNPIGLGTVTLAG